MHIRSRAPLRIGLAGGGTDLESYFQQHGGAVLNLAINRYAFTDLKTGSEACFQAVAADLGQCLRLAPGETMDLKSCKLPLHLAVYRHFVQSFNGGEPVPVVMTTYCDAPVGSGLGSSSTLVVSMVKAWNEFFNAGLDEYAIAETAYMIERQHCGFAGGKQDQYSAAFGGINFIEFQGSGVVVHPLRIKHWFRCELEASLLLHHAGTSRESARIIDDQSRSIASDQERLEQMHAMKACAYAMKNALLRHNSKGICEGLNAGWRAKQRTSRLISNAAIAERIALAEAHGAQACKVSGAGGGGFILFYASPPDAIVLRNRLIETYGSDTFFVSVSEQASEAWVLKDG